MRPDGWSQIEYWCDGVIDDGDFRFVPMWGEARHVDGGFSRSGVNSDIALALGELVHASRRLLCLCETCAEIRRGVILDGAAEIERNVERYIREST